MKRAAIYFMIAIILMTTGCSINIFNNKKWAYDEPKILARARKLMVRPRIESMDLQYNKVFGDDYQLDLRNADLTTGDFTNKLFELNHSKFDNKTQWPEKLPEGFNPARIIRTAKTPGLEVKKLHKVGLTGKKVSVAIINDMLYLDHVEYKDRIRYYEEFGTEPNGFSSEYASKSISIIAGKSIGVAPECDVFYTAASDFNQMSPDRKGIIIKYNMYADALNRILELNESLPKDRKIRVIYIQYELNSKYEGYDKFMEVIKTAMDNGIFIVTPSIKELYGVKISGLGRNPVKDPDNISSYGMSHFEEDNSLYIHRSMGFSENRNLYKYGEDTLLLPMDSMCGALPSDTMDYAFYNVGYMSDAAAYLTGVYALACQANPKITPEEFLKLAVETGDVMNADKDNTAITLGKVVNPAKLMDRIKTLK